MSSGHKGSINFTLCDTLEGMWMISGFQKFLEFNILCQYYLKNIYRFWVSDMQFILYGIYSRMCGVLPWALVTLINCLEVLLLLSIIMLFCFLERFLFYHDSPIYLETNTALVVQKNIIEFRRICSTSSMFREIWWALWEMTEIIHNSYL